ncbi:hypothetical protein ACWC9T_32715 [Kitasatospora sp. NPDC001159]
MRSRGRYGSGSPPKGARPVHLFGQLAPLEELLEVAGGRPVVECAAQSQGAGQHGRGWGCSPATVNSPKP